MKKLIIGFTIIAITISSLSCNTVTSIQKKRHFSDDCHDAYVYFKKHLIKGEDGFSYLKNDTKAEKDLLNFYYYLNGTCFNSTLSQKEVVRIFGEPQIKDLVPRHNETVLKYFIKTPLCNNKVKKDLSNAENHCGILYFFFDENELPTGSSFVIGGPGSLE